MKDESFKIRHEEIHTLSVFMMGIFDKLFYLPTDDQDHDFDLPYWFDQKNDTMDMLSFLSEVTAGITESYPSRYTAERYFSECRARNKKINDFDSLAEKISLESPTDRRADIKAFNLVSTIEAVLLSRGVLRFSPDIYLLATVRAVEGIGMDTLRTIYATVMEKDLMEIERTFPPGEFKEYSQEYNACIQHLLEKVDDLAYDVQVPDMGVNDLVKKYFRLGPLEQVRKLLAPLI